MPIHDYTDDQLVRRALMNAKPRRNGEAPRWVAVMDTFGLGSTYASDLCLAYKLDPDEIVNGVTCKACNP
jgi:hypothetical protein